MVPVDNYVDSVLKSLCLQAFQLGISCGVSTSFWLKMLNFQEKFEWQFVGKN